MPRPDPLELCRACRQYVKGGTIDCPHCGADVEIEFYRYRMKLRAANEAAFKVEQLLRVQAEAAPGSADE